MTELQCDSCHNNHIVSEIKVDDQVKYVCNSFTCRQKYSEAKILRVSCNFCHEFTKGCLQQDVEYIFGPPEDLTNNSNRIYCYDCAVKLFEDGDVVYSIDDNQFYMWDALGSQGQDYRDEPKIIWVDDCDQELPSEIIDHDEENEEKEEDENKIVYRLVDPQKYTKFYREKAKEILNFEF